MMRGGVLGSHTLSLFLPLYAHTGTARGRESMKEDVGCDHLPHCFRAGMMAKVGGGGTVTVQRGRTRVVPRGVG
jgi:hypothetical protein